MRIRTDPRLGALLPFRLAHVARRCPPLRHQSLTLAIAQVKKGKDVQLYEHLCQLAKTLDVTEAAEEDAEWIARTEEANRRELLRLEGELRGYKNNLIRESIRMGQEDLAGHHIATGGPRPDPQDPIAAAGYTVAFTAFSKMRDYCHTPSQISSMTLRLAYTGLLQAALAQQLDAATAGHFSTVHTQAVRLRSSGCKEEEQAQLTAISHVVVGIAALGAGEYSQAAASFMKAPFEYHRLGAIHGMDFERLVASANDVAIYGGLCVLATMSRDELQEVVLGGQFRQFLEQEPHMRKAIGLYVTAKYEQYIALLQHYRADWTLDLFLSAHVDNLFARIRQRSITAYFSSFSQVSIAALAASFPPARRDAGVTPEAAMQDELLSMIQHGQLDARLDVVDGMLFAPHRDHRAQTHEEARRTAAMVERTLLLRLHRVNMSLAELEIRRDSKARDGMDRNGSRLGGAFA
jgi:COP9 signalosome complex subunit 1